MRRFSIILSGAACLVLATAPIVVQAAAIVTSRSNIKHPSVVASPDPAHGTSTACAPKNARTATGAPAVKPADKAGPGATGAMDDCNSVLQGVSTTR